MRILYCKPSGGAFHYITESIISCLRAAGIPTVRWNGNDQEIRDFKPTLYMGCSGHPQNFPKWARDQFGTKIGIHVNPYANKKMPKVHGVDINEPQKAINWTLQQKPDFVYCYAGGPALKEWYHLYQDRHGIKIIPMENAGDPLLYQPVDHDSKWSYEIGFLGGRWGYKAHNLDKYIMPLLKKHKCGVFGWGGWPPPSRKITDSEGNRLFASSKVCPSVSEPHTTLYGIDIPERIFKVPLSGGFTISDPVKGIERITKDVIPLAKNPQQWFDIIEHYLKHDDERRELAKRQREHMLQNHTYFDRMANLFRSIGEDEAAQRCIDRKNLIS